MTRKKVNLGDVLGDTVAVKGSRITDNLVESMLDTKQTIKVSLSKIFISKQIRLKIHPSIVDYVVKTFPTQGLHNLAEIRKVTPAIDEDTVPEGYDYVLLAGEHRFRALEILGLTEHDFSFVPPSIIKTKEDVISYQYSENNARSDMHLVEKVNTLARYLELGRSQAYAAEKMNITTSLASRLNRINKFLTQDDLHKVMELNIKSERVILGISSLIELGYTNWLPVIHPYALNENGEFDPELIYEKTINQIIKDLTAPPEPQPESEPVQESEPEAEQTGTPVTEAPKRLGDDISPKAFQEDAEPQKTASTAQQTASSTVNKSYEDEAEHVPQDTTFVQQQSNTPSANPSAPPPPTSTSPTTKGDEKEASLKLAAKVLQQILSGKEVEEILIELGPDLKKYISKEDAPDIYAMIQTLPFSEPNT